VGIVQVSVELWPNEVCDRHSSDTVVGGKVERNEKEEVFCLPCRTEKKVLWWNWGGELEWSVPRAQKGRAGITNPESVAGTVNQKAVQRREVRVVRQILSL